MLIYKPIEWTVFCSGMSRWGKLCSKLGILLAMGNYLYFLFGFYYGDGMIETQESITGSFAALNKALATVENHFFMLIPVAFMFYICVNYGLLEAIWRDLETLTNKLNQSLSFRQQKMILVGYLTELLALTVVVCIHDLSHLPGYLISYYCFLTPQLYHLVLARTFSELFSAVNNKITEIKARTNEMTVQAAVCQLENAFHLYNDLQEIVQRTNSYFCLYVLAVQASRVFYFSCVMYDIFVNIRYHEPLNIINVTFILLNIIALLAQAIVCEACCQNAHQTVLLAHEMVSCDTPDPIIETISQFSLATITNRVHLTVGGVFSMDMTLVTKMFSLSVTYLVIALQLSNDNCS